MATATQFLLGVQDKQGGWGYRVGGMPYVEPTAAAIIALSNIQSAPTYAIDLGRRFLVSLQRADGGWGIGAIDDESGWMTAWAVLALARAGGAERAIESGVKWLLATEGMRIEDAGTRAEVRELFAMDSSLRGWPWQPGDSAWVQPTALAILGLVAAGSSDEARVHDGVAFLIDRSVPSGGWNMGNPMMIGKEMPPSVQATALVLLALHTAGVEQNAHISAAHQYLVLELETSRSPGELAWGTYALSKWGISADGVRARLAALQARDGSWQGNPFVTAMAILAGGE